MATSGQDRWLSKTELGLQAWSHERKRRGMKVPRRFPGSGQIAAPGQLQTFRESLRKTVGTPPRLHYNENRILKKKRDVAKKKG